MTEPRDPFDDLMRQALAREANQVEPSADGLHRIREQIDQHPPTLRGARKPWMLTVGGAVIATAAAIGLFTVLTDETSRPGTQVAGPETTDPAPETAPETPAPTPSASRSPAPTGGPTGAPTGAPTVRTTTTEPTPSAAEKSQATAVPVYWLGQTVGVDDLGPRLYRTFVQIRGLPAVEAVTQLAIGKPDDSDYSSAWTGARVASVTRDAGVITVDFSRLPTVRPDEKTAPIALQELVYTVQGALQVQDPVRITENGNPVKSIFGVDDVTDPVRRAPQADVQALVWISSPVNGAKTTSPLKVSGYAAAYEATVNWRVVNPKTGMVAKDGSTNAAEARVHSPFSFEVELPLGTWEVQAYQESGEDGSITHSDTKLVTVTR